MQFGRIDNYNNMQPNSTKYIGFFYPSMITTYRAAKLIYGSRALELKKSIKIYYWIWNTDFFHRPVHDL